MDSPNNAELKNNKKEEKKSKCECSRLQYFFIAAAITAVLVLVFALGAAVGKVSNFSHMKGKAVTRSFTPYGNTQMAKEKGGTCPFARNGSIDGKNSNKVFGVMTKVDGNKITVLDNSNKEQIFETTAQTSIVELDEEVGLNDLAAGQKLNIFTSTGDDGKVSVKFIDVIE